jgi:cytochrome c
MGNNQESTMRKPLMTLCATLSMVVPSFAHASLDLAKQKNCLACHAVDAKLVGPAFKDVAKRYAGDKDAQAKLSKKVREGGVGAWGQIPMPANPQVSAAESEALVRWILMIKQ